MSLENLSDTSKGAEGWKAKKVIQQEGANKGNISDVELAQVGAEAEEKYRRSSKGHLDKFLDWTSGGKSGVDLDTGKRTSGYRQGSNIAGQDAMASEIYQRSLDETKPLEIDPRTKEDIAHSAVHEVNVEYNSLKDERKQNEKDQAAEASKGE